MSDPEPPTYCSRELKRLDRDRYLTCLFAPPAEREALFALYAFNLEVARTAEAVSEIMLGRIRLQWWRETVAGIYGGQPRTHQVVTPLTEAVSRYHLPRADFDRLIDSRERDLDAEPPEDMASLADYAEGTSVTLVRLALHVLGTTGPSCLAAGRHVGLAWALAGLLRAIPFHARQKRLYLPADLARTAGLDLRDLFELRSSPALTAIVEQVAARAAEELEAARMLRPEVPVRAIPALLPATLASRYLETLARAGHDPFHSEVQAPVPGRIWRLAWARLRGRY